MDYCILNTFKVSLRSEKEVVKTNCVHDFYCDRCGRHMLTSVEYEDGYYDTPLMVDLSLVMNAPKTPSCQVTKRFTRSYCICDRCIPEYISSMESSITTILGLKDEDTSDD